MLQAGAVKSARTGKRVIATRPGLPLHAEIRMATDYILTRNVIDFTAYRKFEGESKITFDQAK